MSKVYPEHVWNELTCDERKLAVEAAVKVVKELPNIAKGLEKLPIKDNLVCLLRIAQLQTKVDQMDTVTLWH